MTVVIIALLVSAGLASLVGAIMFTVAAFRRSKLWGLAVLFIPFAALFFLVKHWPDVKIAVIVISGGLLLSSVAAIALPGLLADRAYEQQSASLDHPEYRSEAPRGYRVPIQEDSEADPDPGSLFDEPVLEQATPTPAATPTATPRPFPTATPTPAPTTAPPSRPSSRLSPRPPSRLRESVGDFMLLKLRDGREIRVRLVAVRPTNVRVAQRIGGGEMEYTIPTSDIRTFRLFR